MKRTDLSDGVQALALRQMPSRTEDGLLSACQPFIFQKNYDVLCLDWSEATESAASPDRLKEAKAYDAGKQPSFDIQLFI
jgi:hypothetical protein